MCGLFGAYGQFNNKETVMAILCLENMRRGRDSTGISVDGLIYKDTVDAKEFVQRQKFRKLVRTGNIILGHTRLATHGEVSVPNAHPFLINGNLIGTHNGIVSNLHSLRSMIDKNYQVDSQYLLALQDMYGNTDKASGMLNLAFSYRSGEKSNKLFLQKHNNSLAIAEITNDDGTKAYIYSSEGSGLESAILISGLKAQMFNVPNYCRIEIGKDGVKSSTYQGTEAYGNWGLDDEDERFIQQIRYKNARKRGHISDEAILD